MQRPSSDEYNPNYQKYFDLVAKGDYLDLLRQNSIDTVTFFEKIPSEKLDYKYAEDKCSTECLFENLTNAQSKRLCNIATHPMSARAIGYFLIGHVQHHLNIIEKSYL